MDLPIRCECGKVKGKLSGVSPKTVNRLVCYCDDCQAFAHFLDHAGEVLDEHGGTEIMQMAPGHLTFAQGQDELACMRLSEKGIYRWYARCCNTAIANTGGFKLPFVGLIHVCVDAATSAERRQSAFGAVLGPVHGKFARGDLEPGRTPLGVFARFLGVIVKGKFTGEQKRSAFFEAGSGEPIAGPQVLSADELGQLKERVNSAA